jgi:hypothetical protein
MESAAARKIKPVPSIKITAEGSGATAADAESILFSSLTSKGFRFQSTRAHSISVH